MEEDVLSAIRSCPAYIPGGCDRDGHAVIVVNIFNNLEPWNRKYLETCINYFKKSLSEESLSKGVTIIFDAQKHSARFTRHQSRSLQTFFGGDNLASIFLVRSEGFWDKRVDHCAKSHAKDEPIVVTKTRLQKYFDLSELPEELGGTIAYNHDLWIQNRVRLEEFHMKYEKTLNDLENLHLTLLDHKSLRSTETEQNLISCTNIHNEVQSSVKRIIESGNQLIVDISESYRLPTSNNSPNHNSNQNSQRSQNCKIPQDLLDGQKRVEGLINEIEKKQISIRIAWSDIEKSIQEARELSTLEEGVAFVTNWILGTAEQMLNQQQRVGCDVQSCEELRRENEILELQCWETYGFYAELLHKIGSCTVDKETFAYNDLMSQKDFMDFVCRSFATRLERRRNILITSVRFYRLVSEYFDRTSQVFDSLIMGNKVDDFDLATVNLQKLKDSQHSLDNIEKELIKEGEKLSDMLSMPVKDALGRDIGIDYSDDIANVRDILDATIARRNIFIDSVELQKLTLEQVTHIHAYEKDARVAIKWMDDLYSAMIKCHSHVGCNVHEIQVQKEELQTFQETGKSIYNYGCQLLEASLALRQSCKLETKSNMEMSQELCQTWNNLETVSQEHMTRLRVSAVFHRSVEEYCNKLNDLKTAVIAISELEDSERRLIRLRKSLALRERLLVEVGRMVRLGRLLKTRLKEPFVVEYKTNGCSEETTKDINPTGDNSVACDAIANKLTDVSEIAESLDSVLRDTHTGLDLVETNSSSSEKKCEHNRNGSVDEWNSSVRSTEDESFITASDGTPQSRSSSYHTASECRTSPLWSSDKRSLDTENSSELDSSSPLTRLFSGATSSTSTSFDSSDQSYFSAKQSPQFLELEHIEDENQNAVEEPNREETCDEEPIDACEKPQVKQNTEELPPPLPERNRDKLRKRLQEKASEESIPESNSSETNQAPPWSNCYYQNLVAKQAIKGCL